MLHDKGGEAAPFEEYENSALLRFGSQDVPASSMVNGFRVLESFAGGEPLLGVSEVARRVNLSKSTVSRIMATLARMGYLAKDSNADKYRLGVSLLMLAAPLLDSLDIRVAAHPHLLKATEATGETSALAVVEHETLVVVDQVPSPKLIRHTQSLGTQYHDWGSASVRVALAYMESDQAQALLSSGAVDGVPHRISKTGVKRLLQELSDVRATGYAINDGDSDPLEFAVSAPVFDLEANLAGTVVVSAPRVRVTEELRTQIIETTVSSAQGISRRLSGRPSPNA